MGFHDNGRDHAKMKEELLEQGELEPVRLTLLAQENERQNDHDPVHIGDVVNRVLEPVQRVAATISRIAAPAGKVLAPAAPFLAPLIAFIRPSFLPKAGAPRAKLRKTAYLDGMRGVAALMVFFLHNQMWAHAYAGGSMYLENVFGFHGNYFFGALPVIRLAFSGGHFAVSTFFVLSGYVLSVKPLTLITNGDYVALGDNVSQALFKRWLRLYIPIIFVTFFVMISPHVWGVRMTFIPQGNLKDEIWKWYCDLKNTFFIFDTGGRVLLDYHSHIWSIPVEFKGSIVIYTSLMSFSRMTQNARHLCQCALWYYFMYIVDGSYYAMFMAGMIICDLEMCAANGTLPGWMLKLSPYKTQIFYTMFGIAIWWAGLPPNSIDIQHMRESPGWYWLSFLKPQAVFDYRWFFLHWAAAFLVASTPHIPWLKRIFESHYAVYLGRVSYMLYLLHGPILWSIGDRLYVAVGWIKHGDVLNLPGWPNCMRLPQWGPFGMEFNYIVVLAFLFVLTLWVAEMATTLLDDQSVRFVTWLYKQMLPEKPPKVDSRGEKAPGSPKAEP